MHIDGRPIAPDAPTFVIAEIGVNHDGSLGRALDLVRAAADAGADAVKLQLFAADRLLHATAGLAGYQRGGTDDAASMLRALELSPDDAATVCDAARDAGLVPLATPFSPADVTTAHHLRLPAVKIASPDLANPILLDAAASLGVPMLVSTGASTAEEIRRAASWLWRRDADFALLHCVSAYPAPAADANLAWVGDLARKYGVPVGYSDHTAEPLAGALAVASGACVVEKHLTHDRRAPGPDHAASFDPAQFAAYVAAIRTADRLRGTGGPRRVLACEADVRRVARQSLVLARALPAGAAVLAGDLIAQRPGDGIPAADLSRVVGRRASRPLAAGAVLAWGDLADGRAGDTGDTGDTGGVPAAVAA